MDKKANGKKKKAIPDPRNQTIKVRVNEKEFSFIQERAREMEKNCSEFIRESAIKGKVIVIPEVKDFTSVLIGVHRQLDELKENENKAILKEELAKMLIVIGKIIEKHEKLSDQ